MPDSGLLKGTMRCQFEKGQVSADKHDSVFELWVDGKLEAARTDLDWQGGWEDYAINAVFLENYWNKGSTRRQARWFDNFIISTQPVGPITATKPPLIHRTKTAGSLDWEIEVATDPQGSDIVWNSRPVEASTASVTVDGAHGTFTGSCAGEQALNVGATNWVRIKEVGQGDWAPWHMPFR